MDMCRVENKHPKDDFVGKYENTKFVIKKGKSAIVPRAAVNLWFGDPDARDNEHDRRYSQRNDEFQRIRVKYGVYDDMDLWDKNTPKVKVYDLEDNKLITVVDDPTGETLDDHASTLPTRLEQDMAQQMKDMERQLEAMKRAMADAQAGEVGGMGRTPTEGQSNRSDDDPEADADADAADDDDDDDVVDPDSDPDNLDMNNEPDPDTPIVQAGVVEDKPRRVRGGSST